MTQRPTTKEDYIKRINIISEYINNHLDEDIDMMKLAEISCFSLWHFHRITRAYFGEPLGTYITRTRLEKAAKQLRYSNIAINEIAYQVGYNVPSSFSKAFRALYGFSPNDYRNNKDLIIMKQSRLNEKLNLKSPKILELNPKQVIYIKLTGNYGELDFGSAWQKLWQYVKEQKLFTKGMEHIAIYYDDPKITDPNKLRTDICLAIHKKTESKGEIGVKTIEGGRFAVFLYQGTYDKLDMVYDTIYSEWLPESGYKLRNYQCFEKYISNPARVAPEKLKTEIYIAIE
ncbi:MAG: AraC family transcriptional regulator [Bacteroidales bacterium]|jgi:AraC family transcriptional regulator|nr:AraC family transcriptional regulator [Bacteroidales bacterium]